MELIYAVISATQMEFNIIVKQNQEKLMCFLKLIPELSQLSTTPTLTKEDPSHSAEPKPNTFDQKPCVHFQLEALLPWLCAQQLVTNSMALLSSNRDLMQTAQQSLHRAETLISQLESSFSEMSTDSESPPKRTMPTICESTDQQESTPENTSNNLLKKLFGAKKYTYTLRSTSDFPQLLYKERNFGLGVKLVDQNSGKIKQNGNVVNLCMGVCDGQGNWIHETKEGAGFLKGKAESELFNGEGSFLKMALRDVSRGFSGKTLNLVIYAKPSLLRYSEDDSISQRVDPERIEPLIIKGIVVKAKKRE